MVQQIATSAGFRTLTSIERRPRGHLGFGGGVHGCLGAMVARMAVRILFEEWLPRIPEFTRVERELAWVPSTTFRSPLSLRLGRG